MLIEIYKPLIGVALADDTQRQLGWRPFLSRTTKHASLCSSIDQGGGKRRGFTRPWAPGLHRRRRIEVAIDEAPAPQPLCRVRSDGDCRKTNSKAREEATHRKPDVAAVWTN